MVGTIIFGGAAVLFLIGIIGYLIHFIYRVIRGERFVEEKPEETPENELDIEDKSKILIYFVAVSLFAVWFFFGRNYVGAPDFRVNADQVFSEYTTGELAAHTKYYDKTVQVTGEVVASGVSAGAPWVMLYGGGHKRGVQCFFPKKRTAEAASMTKGSQVTFKGVMLEKAIMVVLNKCSKV